MQYHKSRSQSGDSSQNGSESDGRSLIEDHTTKQNQIQREDSSHNLRCGQNELAIIQDPTPPYNFLCIFTQLSRFVFDLRRDQSSLVQDHTFISLQTSSVPLQQIFQKVSNFVEIFKTATNRLDLMMSQGATSETQSLTHLSLIVISITVDIYLSLAQTGIVAPNSTSRETTAFADNAHNSIPWRSVEISRQQDCINSLIRACNYPSLTVVLNLTVMDFHMAQFQGLILQMFSFLLAVDQGASEELQKTQAQTSHVRARLQSSINSIMSGDVP